MNEVYTTVSTVANIEQAVFDAMRKLNPENVQVPTDDQELMNDIQATLARHLEGGK
ncbi:hypothetical protein Q7378_01060 [Glaesserella parasuis]|uniref:hypothetical protein n=1 Tax=Glaesserella parasuis TaxID=738 RepID=UPI0002E0C280|nr:hypothetical protein [Glaesserella parasuis]MDG6281870.1 hypothetical protein [Glaesserella parasuis]MDG6324431.1 hypothetical protein [Glaesserella parasuis]MDG6456603.1 hypothetical protein [Glaesserella parasuis]MDG6789126.1 hypothetical protein [Glaesserella parasuis]MDG6806775.1 hypothetical protein [Glaesserella parasuis]